MLLITAVAGLLGMAFATPANQQASQDLGTVLEGYTTLTTFTKLIKVGLPEIPQKHSRMTHACHSHILTFYSNYPTTRELR